MVLPESTPFLKTCTLCGCLNTRSEFECVCCGWRGVFDHDQQAVRRALGALYPPREETLLGWFLKAISG